MEKIKCIAVFGPTASGKTDLAVKLAKHFDGEIISADSMQIYKKMQIGTAKPTYEEMGGIVHHLVDFLEPEESFSVAQYVSMAKACVEDIDKRGKLPIIAGGTGLYIRSLLNDIDFPEEGEISDLREKLNRDAIEYGGEYLLKKVEAFDPEYAGSLHPNNIKRIIRAIELYESTGRTMSEQIKLSEEKESKFDACKIAITFKDREKLYDRINLRVDKMMKSGLLEEAYEVFSGAFGKTAVQAIGYKELFPYFEGNISVFEAVENIKKETRHYAKRQLTWIRREKDIAFLEADVLGEQNLFENAKSICESFLL